MNLILKSSFFIFLMFLLFCCRNEQIKEAEIVIDFDNVEHKSDSSLYFILNMKMINGDILKYLDEKFESKEQLFDYLSYDIQQHMSFKSESADLNVIFFHFERGNFQGGNLKFNVVLSVSKDIEYIKLSVNSNYIGLIENEIKLGL